MKQEIAKLLFVFAAGFLLCFTLISPKDKKNGVSPCEPKIETIIDTVEIPKPYPVVKDTIIYKPKPYKVIDIDTVYITTQNSYRDTLEIEPQLDVYYDATTVGYLESIKLGVRDNRPTKIIREKTTETIIKYSSGLYLGVTSDLNLNTSVGLQYHRGKNMFGVSTKLNEQSFEEPTKYNLSYHRRLF